MELIHAVSVKGPDNQIYIMTYERHNSRDGIHMFKDGASDVGRVHFEVRRYTKWIKVKPKVVVNMDNDGVWNPW